MSAIFGRSKQPQKPAATGLELQTSTNAIPVPLVWGRGRIAPNIIWYDGFRARKVKVGGGKGGPSQKTWKYSVSVILGVCEGPINDINNVWRDLYFKENGASFKTKNSAVEYLGTYTQTPWPFLASNYASAALAYRGVSYLGIPNYDLGESTSMPQHSVEVNGLLYNTAINSTSPDADPALLVQDFLTNPHYGTPFRASSLDLVSLLSGPNATTTGDSAYQTYCRAMGFGLSPELSDQEQGSSILERWLMLTNSMPVWSGSFLKIIPLGDETITANGVTYVPDIAVRYHLTMDDFQYNSDEDPVRYIRSDTTEAKNAIYLNVSDRNDDYALKPVGAKDQASIEAFGKLQADTIEADEIKSIEMGVTLAHLILQRRAYVRNEYSFRLDQRFIQLEAMDVVTLTVPHMGLEAFRVRITRVEENEDGQLDVEAEDFPDGLGSTVQYSSQVNEATPVNSNQNPGNVSPPVILEAPPALTNGNPEIWMTVTGAAEYWGGCEIHLSTDGTDYYLIGEVQNEARMGELSADLATFVLPNPDVTNTLSVDLTISKGELDSGTALDAANGVTLCYVGGELIAYEDATLTAQYEYDLTTLYRGLYGSTIAAHTTGDQFARLDDTVFRYLLPQEYVGQTLYLKFVSFNIWGTSLQDISALSPYVFTPTGVAWTLDPPSSVTLTPVATTLPDGSSSIALNVSWPSSPSQLIDRYDIQISIDGSGVWINAPSAPGDTLEAQYQGALANTDYKSRVRAVRTSGQAITSSWQESSVVNSGGVSTVAPDPATSVTATDAVGGIVVKWTASPSSAVSGYYIYGVNNHTGAFGDASVIGTVGKGTNEYFHAGLAGGDEWRYWVVAYNTAGPSTPAGPADGTADSAGGSIEIQEDSVPVVASASLLNFTGSGVTVTDDGGGAVTIDIPGGGGGGGGGGSAFFAGATGSTDHTGSTSSYATKGIVFVPKQDVTVTHVWAQVNASNASNSFYAQIAELSSLTRGSPDTNLVSAATVGSVIGSSAPQVVGTTNAKMMRMELTTPTDLVAGTPYIFLLVFDQGSGTAAARVAATNANTTDVFVLNAPGETLLGAIQFDTVGVSPTQTPALITTGYYQVCIEGFVAGSSGSGFAPGVSLLYADETIGNMAGAITSTWKTLNTFTVPANSVDPGEYLEVDYFIYNNGSGSGRAHRLSIFDGTNTVTTTRTENTSSRAFVWKHKLLNLGSSQVRRTIYESGGALGSYVNGSEWLRTSFDSVLDFTQPLVISVEGFSTAGSPPTNTIECFKFNILRVGKAAIVPPFTVVPQLCYWEDIDDMQWDDGEPLAFDELGVST